MKAGFIPLILVTLTDDNAYDGQRLRNDYCRALAQAGAQPLLLPHGETLHVERLLDIADGVLLSGGGDPAPALFGEDALLAPEGYNARRDELEIRLVQGAWEKKLPLFGICRGMQMINVARGGSLYQDLTLCLGKGLVKHQQEEDRHHPTHEVWLTDPLLQNRLGKRVFTNSHHHQGIKGLAPELRQAGHTADGLCEAFVATDDRFCLGVQWHPECLCPAMQPLFDAFVQTTKRERL